MGYIIGVPIIGYTCKKKICPKTFFTKLYDHLSLIFLNWPNRSFILYYVCICTLSYALSSFILSCGYAANHNFYSNTRDEQHSSMYVPLFSDQIIALNEDSV